MFMLLSTYHFAVVTLNEACKRIVEPKCSSAYLLISLCRRNALSATACVEQSFRLDGARICISAIIVFSACTFSLRPFSVVNSNFHFQHLL